MKDRSDRRHKLNADGVNDNMTVRLVASQIHGSRSQAMPTGDIAGWILEEGRCIAERASFLDELCWRLIGAHLPLWRATLHIGTLHPQLRAVACRWWRDRPVIEEIVAKHGIERTGAYLDSPVLSVVEHGEPVRYRLDKPGIGHQIPLLVELSADGVTGYLALPLTFSTGRHSVITFATKRAKGFTRAHVTRLTSILPPLRAVLEIHATREIAANLLNIYVGRQAASRVLEGQIRRGSGERIDAVILVADMRNFTRLSNQLAGEAMIELLNEFFEHFVEPIHSHGGEVLKFLGDGLIAIFSIATCGGQGPASECALEVARSALVSLDNLNTRRAERGDAPIGVGVALHAGQVIYGNVGAADRLDFTAIGPAVNLTTRLESLTKITGRKLLASEYFSQIYPGHLISVGSFTLPGLDEPQEVFALP